VNKELPMQNRLLALGALAAIGFALQALSPAPLSDAVIPPAHAETLTLNQCLVEYCLSDETSNYQGQCKAGGANYGTLLPEICVMVAPQNPACSMFEFMGEVCSSINTLGTQ
jgi:hypothetical protein